MQQVPYQEIVRLEPHHVYAAGSQSCVIGLADDRPVVSYVRQPVGVSCIDLNFKYAPLFDRGFHRNTSFVKKNDGVNALYKRKGKANLFYPVPGSLEHYRSHWVSADRLIAEYELQSYEIREKVLKGHGLKHSQLQLPTLHHAAKIAQHGLFSFLPTLFEEIITPEDREWMEGDHSGKSLPQILGEMGPPRELRFTNKQQELWDMISEFGAISIEQAFAQERIRSARRIRNSGKRDTKINLEQQQLFQNYEALCEAFVEAASKPRRELGPIARFVKDSFPGIQIYPDLTLPSAARPKRNAHRRKSVPEADC